MPEYKEMKRVLMVLLAVLFVAALANVALADEGNIIVNGQVMEVDPASNTLTMKATESNGNLPEGTELTIMMEGNPRVFMCDENRSISSINVGDRISISFYQIDGRPVADSLAIAVSPQNPDVRC